MALFNPNSAFNNLRAQKIIDEAFLLCGIQPEQIDSKLIDAALFSLNSIISSWCNEGVLQYTQTQTLIKLQNNLIRYILPKRFYDVYDFNLASMGRRRHGTPYSNSGGNAASAFDQNLSTACTQTSPNGTIGLDFTPVIDDTPIRVDFWGVLSNVDSYYQIVVEGTNDDVNWIPLYTMERPEFFSGYPSELSILWFQINQPQVFKKLQIREIGGNTLNIREIYFEQYIQSWYRKNIGRSNYMQMSSRDIKSNITLYSLEKQAKNVIVNVYPAPSDIPEIQDYTPNSEFFNFALMRAVEFPIDINFLRDTININRLFFPPLQYCLAKELAIKIGRLDLVETLTNISVIELEKAKFNNNDLGGLAVQKSTYTS